MSGNPPMPGLSSPQRGPRPRPALAPYHALRANEYRTDIQFMVNNPSRALVTYPGGIWSPQWPCSLIPSNIAEALGCVLFEIPPGEPRTSRGPRNRVYCTHYVWIWWRPVHFADWPFYLMRVRVLNYERYGDLGGVSLLLGRDFINVLLSGMVIPSYVPPTLQPAGVVDEENQVLSRPALEDDMMGTVSSWLQEVYPEF